MQHNPLDIRTYVAHHPERIRTIARSLNLPEALIVAAHLPSDNTPADDSWRLQALRLQVDPLVLCGKLLTLGSFMLLTRNDAAVSEITDTIQRIQKIDANTINLYGMQGKWHIDCSAWQEIFFVTEMSRGTQRLSIQIYDYYGEAICKLYVTADTSSTSWSHILDSYQVSTLMPWSDIVASFRNPAPTHEKPSVCSTQRAPLPVAALPSAIDGWLQTLPSQTQGLVITVSHRFFSQQYRGTVERYLRIPGWVNFLDPTFNLHLQIDAVHSIALLPPTQPTEQSTVLFQGAQRESLVSFEAIGSTCTWADHLRTFFSFH